MVNEESWYLSNATMAMLLLSASMGKVPREISKLSGKLAELKNKRIDIGDISISRVPAGYYSEQFDRFLGSLLVAGDATKRSPVKLEESGTKLCQEIIQEACQMNRRKLEPIAHSLELDLNMICKI